MYVLNSRELLLRKVGETSIVNIDEATKLTEYRMCREKAETVNHLVSECSKLAQRDYRGRHDSVVRYVHLQLCGRRGLEKADRWYNQQLEAIIENVEPPQTNS